MSKHERMDICVPPGAHYDIVRECYVLTRTAVDELLQTLTASELVVLLP